MMRKHSCSGFSLVEILVVVAIISVMMMLVYGMMEDATRASMFTESHTDLAMFGQRTINELQTEISQSRTAYFDDTTGRAYLAALQLPVAYPVWGSTSLPNPQPSLQLTPDTDSGANRFVGNSLLLVKQLAPIQVSYDHDATSATPTIHFLADVYRFQYYYLTPNRARNFKGRGFFLDMIESRSVVYADFLQLSRSGLTTAQLQEIVPQLIAAEVKLAWNSSTTADNAFYDLEAARSGAFATPLAAHRVEMARTRSMFKEMMGGRVTGRMDYSVAFRTQGLALRHPVPRFAAPDSLRPDFPGGFEVKIAGPAGNRKVLTRIVLMSNYAVSTHESQESFAITSARF